MLITATNNGKQYNLPENPIWRKGFPPSIGWWPASTNLSQTELRYFDGKCWSDSVYPFLSETTAAFYALVKIKSIKIKNLIMWTDQWWLTCEVPQETSTELHNDGTPKSRGNAFDIPRASAISKDLKNSDNKQTSESDGRLYDISGRKGARLSPRANSFKKIF